LNLRPSGYEPDELPGCSTPRRGRGGPRGRGRVWCATALRSRGGDGVGGLGDGWWTWRRPTLPRLEAQYHGRGGVSRPSSEWIGWGTRAIGHQVDEPPPWLPSSQAAQRARRRPALPPDGRHPGEDTCRQGWHGGLEGCGCRCWGSRSFERLGPVSCVRRRTSTPGLSTWWSTTALMARPGLAVGFPLRCVQRLSCPNLATRLRGWRHDRSTRGSSTPVLSY
jgi:hypothetical protein